VSSRKTLSIQANQSVPASALPDSRAQLTEALGRVRILEEDIASAIQEMEEKVHQLEMLNEVSSLLNSTLETAQVREKALEATCKLLHCETGSLVLIDEKTNELYWETALGEAGSELKQSLRLPINDKSIAGFVAMTGECLVINDVEQDSHYRKNTSTHFKTVSMVCVPLLTKGKIIGVLQALNKKSGKNRGCFSTHDGKLMQTLSHQVATAIDNSRLYETIRSNFYQTVEALAEAIAKKDRYTGGHTKRVVHYSICIGKYMGLSTETLEQIRLGAVLHDIGKIGIEDAILKKKSPLDSEEWKIMQKHPEIGSDILRGVAGLTESQAGVRFHHERWDGLGYPSGMKGQEIPLIARVISVADTYDAMVSTRPYRKGLDPKVAYEEIIKHSGTQFDPRVVEAFKMAFSREKMGKGSGGSSFYGL